MGRGLRGGSLAALVLAALVGCGSEGATRFPGASLTEAGGGGELRYAIAADPGDLDPLGAETISARTVVTQVFEPLVQGLDAPYRGGPDRRGVAVAWEHSGDFRVWTFQLRSGIRFQDGTPLNANAVVVNAERWRSEETGVSLLSGLIAADAPSPSLVRMILSQPDPRLPKQLADPRLGIVSPAALSTESGADAELVGSREAGSGPFALRGRDGEAILLGRNRDWWGSRRGLGPALDRISFRIEPDPRQRVAALREGAVRVAGEIPRRLAIPLRREPLVTTAGTASGHAAGFERSVRGISDWRPAPLSDVWVALLEPG